MSLTPCIVIGNTVTVYIKQYDCNDVLVLFLFTAGGQR